MNKLSTLALLLLLLTCTQLTTCQTTKYHATVVAGGFIPQPNVVDAKDSLLAYPMGLSITTKNELYIGAYFSNRVKKLRTDNVVEVVAGNGYLGHDGYGLTIANDTRLKYPMDVKVNETTGEVFIADIYDECIRKVFPNGTTIIIGGVVNYRSYLTNAPAIGASIGRPVTLALLDGDVYFSDTLYQTIGKISVDGQYSLVAGTPGVAGYNNSDGKLAINAQFNNLRGIAINSKKEILVMDTLNYRLRKILSNGTIITIAGTGSSGNTDGNALSASFSSDAWAIAIDSLTNSVYITDGNRLRRLVNETIVETVAGSSTYGYTGDGGLATSATFRTIRGVVVDKSGNVYISDQNNHRIRKIDFVTKIVTTIAGNGEYGYTENTNATQVVLTYPYSYVNEEGEIFIVDTQRYAIRKVNKSGIITTICGLDGVSGIGVGGLAINTQLVAPKHITQRFNGDFVFLDSSRAAYWISSNGFVTFYSKVGVLQQSLDNPQFSTFINQDELLISDSKNHRLIRLDVIKLGSSNIGSGIAGYIDSDAFLGAQFNSPMAAVMDKNGDIIIADTFNNLIRKAYSNGTVTTIAGIYGSSSYNGDNIPAKQAALYRPFCVAVNSIGEVFLVGKGVAEFNMASGEATQVSIISPRSINVLSNGDIYIAEYENNLIRKLTPYCQSNQYFNTTLQACVCNQEGYYGEYCELFQCNNIVFNSSLVCSAHGQCLSPNNCSCSNAYFGSNCDLFNCDGIGCLHNGTCSGPGTCLCPQQYGGLRCEYLICYNKTEIESTICSGHGQCVEYNNCSCNSNWYGKDCSVTNCYGIPSNQSNSCGGNGTCVGPDKCSCNYGHDGSQCQYLVCNNKLETDLQICSAHGKCVSPDNCQCNYGFVGSNCQYYQVYLDIPNALIYATDGPIFNSSKEFFDCSYFIGSSQLNDLGESDFVKCYWTQSVFKIYLGYGHNIGNGYILYFSNDVVVRVNANSSLTNVQSMSLTSSVNDVLSTLPQSQDVVLMSNANDYFHNFNNVKRVWSCSKCSTDISNRLALFVNKTMVHIPISLMNALSLDQNFLKSIDLLLVSTSSIGMISSDAEKSARIQPSTKSTPPSITWQGNNFKKSGYSCVGHNCIVEVGLNSLNTSISYTFSGFFSLLNSDFANKQMVRLVNVYEGELVDSEYSSNAQIYCFHLKTFITLSYQYDFVYTTFDRLDFVLLNVNRTYSLNDISSISISPKIDDPFITRFTVSDYLSYQYECYQIASSTNWTILGGNLCSSMAPGLVLDSKSLLWSKGTYLIKLTITVTQTYLTRYFKYNGWIELVSGMSSSPTMSYSPPPAISPSHQPLTLSAVVKSDSQISLSWELVSGKFINVDNSLPNIVTKSLAGYSKKTTIVLNNRYLMQGESYTVKLTATNQQGKTDVYFTTRIDQTPRFSCSYWNLRNEDNIAYESLLAISCFNLPNEPISAFQVEFYSLSGYRLNTVSNTFKKNIITPIPIYSADESVNLVVKLLNRYGSMSNITRSISVQLPSTILNGTKTFTSKYEYVNDQFYILKRSQPLRVDTSSSIHSLLSILIQNSTIYQFISDAKSNLVSLDSMNAMFKDMISLLKNIDGITYKVEEKLVQLLLPTVSKLISILDITDSSNYVESQIETWLTWIYSGMSSAKSYYPSLIISQLFDDQHYSQIQIIHNILVRRYANNLSKQQAIQDFTSKFALLTGYAPNNSSSLESIEISDELNGKSIQVSDAYSTNVYLPSDLSSQITLSSEFRLFYSSSFVENDYTQGNILTTRPILDVTLYDSNGKSVSVSNLNTPISIRFGELKTTAKDTLNISCIYYDSSLQSWSNYGIQSTYSIIRRENGYVYFTLECNTTHLTLFSALETASTPNQTIVVSSTGLVKQSDDSSLIIILSTVIPISVLLIAVFIIVVVILSCVIYHLKNKKSKNDFLNKTNTELDFMSGDFPTESLFFQPLSSFSSSGNYSSSSSFNPMSRYLNLERIGQGAFGSVFKADDTKTSTKKAIKVMKFTSMEELNSIMKEGSQLMNVTHPNILKVNDFFVSKDQLLCIDMDFYELGDLQKLTKQDYTCSESIVRQIIQQMCGALDYIHNSMNIIHRDIKPTNIFIKKMDENDIHVIVADFGLAKANSASIQNSYAGTPLYMSPELGFGASYSHNTDVYSLGVTIYQIMTKDTQTSISQLYVMKDQGQVKNIINENLSNSPVKYSSKLIDIVITMIDKDPLTRPQPRDILLSMK